MSPHSGRPRASDLAERGIDTRQNILDAFARLIAEQGFDATSVAAIAAEVGVSKGTVVHHFATKEVMLQESHLQYISRRVDEMSNVLAHVDDPSLQLTSMIYCVVRAHRDDRAGTIAFLREFARFASSPLSAELQGLRAEYTSMMTSIIRRASAQGTFDVENPVITALQVFGMVNYMWTWYRTDRTEDAEHIAAQFAVNILTGLLARPQEVARPSASGVPLTVEALVNFIESIHPLLAPVQENAPTRLVASRSRAGIRSGL